MRGLIYYGAMALLLGGCTTRPQVPPPLAQPDLSAELRFTPPLPDAGQCWHSSERPAQFETVTEQRLDPLRGIVSESVQRELRPRSRIWFRIPCPPEVGGADLFYASLQRALKARGLYEGPVTGEPDGATLTALQRYQAAAGLNSPILSRGAALSLGLIAH
ncbi:peptidoglycan-binding domain-containing protein [Falsigemmobacter faecalis]|uniref:Peptidoglycan-binding protein n=1 Tax=Falsigemmobacter faecalis TaxID=2488730 RepID=A0A3P3DI48_9RHOB|nr:peptidoglycan-binding domain-containing protein [Falsigemmobacter faecalis]RRH73920.1 peptidoglycan-binding protein [Falsigemmobacter faecalis]